MLAQGGFTSSQRESLEGSSRWWSRLIGIMGRLAEANGIGSLGLHRRRIHRRSGQEVDKVFS